MDSAGQAAFLDAVGTSPRLWRAIDWRTIAYRVHGVWHNLGTRVYLDARETGSVPVFDTLPDTPELLVLHRVFAFERLEELIEGLARGEVSVGEEAVRFKRMETGKEEGAYPFNFSFLDLSEPSHRRYRYWSALAVTGYGPDMRSLLREADTTAEELDRALRVGRPTYDGLGDLEVYFLGRPHPTPPGNLIGCELFAPFEAALDKAHCGIQAGELRVQIRAGWGGARNHCAVGFMGIGDGVFPTHKTLGADELRWVEADQDWTGSIETEIGPMQLGKLILKVGDWPVDRMALKDLRRPSENRRRIAYQVVDAEEELLREWLQPEGPDRGNQFERAVTRVFVFLGYQVDQLAGDRKLSNGVDFIAHEPHREVLLAVECTTGTPDAGGKMGKLVSRARTIAGVLPDVRVIPVLVTALPRESVPEAAIDDGAKSGVALVCREELDALLRLADADAPADQATALIEGVVPGEEVKGWAGHLLDRNARGDIGPPVP